MTLRFAPIPPVTTAPSGTDEVVRAVHAARLVTAALARRRYAVNGRGVTAAVLDSGIRDTHRRFRAWPPPGATTIDAHHNVTQDNLGDERDVWDGHGHGCHVAGTLATVAPGARLAAIKVLGNNKPGPGSMMQLVKGLDWVLAARLRSPIVVVCLSLGGSDNYSHVPNSSSDAVMEQIQECIVKLTQAQVAVVVAAGNHYQEKRRQGMCFPAILPDCISVGAVNGGDHEQPRQLLESSARMSLQRGLGTTLFAPGAAISAAGIRSDAHKTMLSGTSQATPIVAGAIALMQEYHLREQGCLAEVSAVRRWLRDGARDINDDSPAGNGAPYKLLDVCGAFDQMVAALGPNGQRQGAGALYRSYRSS